MANLWLTDHFKFRMMERGIDIDHVKQAVNSPDLIKHNDDGSILVRKTLGSRRAIEVVYREQFVRGKTAFIMITAYYLIE